MKQAQRSFFIVENANCVSIFKVHVAQKKFFRCSNWLRRLNFRLSSMCYQCFTPKIIKKKVNEYPHPCNDFMFALCKNPSLGSKDAWIFHQPQEINLMEHTFDILVHRRAILRRTMLHSMNLHKIKAPKYSLCAFYNYCINESNQEHCKNIKLTLSILQKHTSMSMVNIIEILCLFKS